MSRDKPVLVRTVHGQYDSVEQEFDTFEEAIATVSDQEKSRHGEEFEVWDMKYTRQTKNCIQFGTNYHYIELFRAAEDT